MREKVAFLSCILTASWSVCCVRGELIKIVRARCSFNRNIRLQPLVSIVMQKSALL